MISFHMYSSSSVALVHTGVFNRGVHVPLKEQLFYPWWLLVPLRLDFIAVPVVHPIYILGGCVRCNEWCYLIPLVQMNKILLKALV